MSERVVVEGSTVARPMTVQVLKTKAETALSEQFAAVEGKLPGGAGIRGLRRSAIGAFVAAGLPHRRVEEWKYTDLKSLYKEALKPAAASRPGQAGAAAIDAALGPLSALDAHRIVLVDGRFRPDLSSVAGLGSQVTFDPLEALMLQEPASLMRRLTGSARQSEPLVALNTAFMTDGAVLSIERGAAIAEPLLIIHVSAHPEPHAVATRNVITVGDGASVTLIEAHVALPAASPLTQENALTWLDIGNEARVAHVKLVTVRERVLHLAPWEVTLGRAAVYRPFQMTMGSGVVRNDIKVAFAGKGGMLGLGAAFLMDHTGHADTTLVVDHAVPGCTSRELVKGVLDDHARGVFQGKVIVRPGAQKTDGKQMAQALMLSPDAEFDSKPELEIFADDVVCGHGSTAAELDEDLIFYCRSRGIPPAEAKALLVESFVGEAIDKIEEEGVRDALLQLARSWLAAGQGKQAAA